MKYPLKNILSYSIQSFRKEKTLFFSASTGTPNFGDCLSLEIVNHLSKYRFRKASYDTAQMIAIGSILDLYLLKTGEKKSKKTLDVWGAGFIAQEGEHHRFGNKATNRFAREMKFSAVRGLLTLERVKRMGYDLNISVGDPGLLASYLTDGKFDTNIPKYELGIIAHYADRHDPILKEIEDLIPNSIILDILKPPKILIRDINKCETIISSAMHGLIAADSLGIPNKWVAVSNRLHGGDYKFKDYYSLFDTQPNPILIERIRRYSKDLVKIIKDEYTIEKNQIDKIKNKLVNSAPFKLKKGFKLLKKV